ncbi:unnamed protein product, partial [Cyprideis torosa]
LDAKHRVAIPARYRDQLMDSCGGQLVMTVDSNGYLVIYPLGEWEEIERKVMSLPNSDKRVRRFQRFFVGHASEVELSAQGRFVIPEPLREFAEISKQAVLIGQGSKFELWSAERWKVEFDDWAGEEDQDEDISELMGSISF